MCICTDMYASETEADKISSEGVETLATVVTGALRVGLGSPAPPVQDPLHDAELQQLALTFKSVQLVLVCLINRLWSDF